MQAILDYFKYSQGNIYALAVCGGISLFCLILFALTFLIHKRQPKARPAKAGISSEARYCPNCGKAAQAGSVFCKHCGTKLG